ncbi:MAG: hypothetical protein ABI863_15055 [Ginsengibacter sp.]
MNILIFKTNIRRKKDLSVISPLLSAYDSIVKWNADRDDADKILRIVSTSNDPVDIIKTINGA